MADVPVRKMSTMPVLNEALGATLPGLSPQGTAARVRVGGAYGLAQNAADGIPLRDRIQTVEMAQVTGLPGYSTFDDLPAPGMLQPSIPGSKVLAFVSRDPEVERNGVWEDNGTVWLPALDRTSHLASRLNDIGEGNFPALELQMRTFDSWSEYSWGVGNQRGIFPIAVRNDGGVEIGELFVGGAELRPRVLDSWSGYVWAVGDESGRFPIAVRSSGSVEIRSIVTEEINGQHISEFVAHSLLQLERATQEWWISPQHTSICRPYERVISGLYGEGGEIIAAEYSPTIGKTRSTIVSKTPIVDDHNTPALWAENGRRAVIMWTQHNATQTIEIRVSDRSADISSFTVAPAIVIPLGVATSYTQAFKIRQLSDAETDVLWVFSRLGGNKWGIKPISISQDDGAVDQSIALINLVQAPEQFYISVAEAHGSGQNLRVAGSFNPAAARNSVYYFEIDTLNGDVRDSHGSVLANVFSGVGLPMQTESLVPVLPQTASSTDRRLFYVRPGPISPAIAYAEWPISSPAAATYWVASLTGSIWVPRDHGQSGPAFGYVATANYIAGISFPDPCSTDQVYVARRANETDLLELHETNPVGQRLVSTLAENRNARIVRPIVPMGGSPIVTYGVITKYSPTDFTFEGSVDSTRRWK